MYLNLYYEGGGMKLYMVLLLLILNGCSNNLYMSSYTRVGIDLSEDGVGIGSKNATINTAPTNSKGEAFDVLGTIDLDIKTTGIILKEVVATGLASECASYEMPNDPTEKNNEALTKFVTISNNKFINSENNEAGILFFGSYTSWSLIDLSWRQATGSGLNFGYKRGVGLKMPVKNDSIGSVYADLSLNTTEEGDEETKSKIEGYRSIQTFATGRPAIIKASRNSERLTNNALIKGCLPEKLITN